MRDTVWNQGQLAAMVGVIGIDLADEALARALRDTRDARRHSLVLEASILAEMRERGINVRVMDSDPFHGRSGG